MEITKSVSQRSSSVSSMLFKKRMEAETQRANVQFREKELAILKQKASLRETEAKRQAESERKKAELEATHHFLEEERKAAVAEAEVRALENFDSESKHRSIIPTHIDTPVNRNQHTARYINNHSDDKFDMDPFSTCESESVLHILSMKSQTTKRLQLFKNLYWKNYQVWVKCKNSWKSNSCEWSYKICTQERFVVLKILTLQR